MLASRRLVLGAALLAPLALYPLLGTVVVVHGLVTHAAQFPSVGGRFSLLRGETPITLGREAAQGILVGAYVLLVAGALWRKTLALAALPALDVSFVASGSRGPVRFVAASFVAAVVNASFSGDVDFNSAVRLGSGLTIGLARRLLPETGFEPARWARRLRRKARAPREDAELPDAGPPRGAIVSPADGSTVAGTVAVSAVPANTGWTVSGLVIEVGVGDAWTELEPPPVEEAYEVALVSRGALSRQRRVTVVPTRERAEQLKAVLDAEQTGGPELAEITPVRGRHPDGGSWETTALPDGPYRLRAVTTDIAGHRVESPVIAVEVRNEPVVVDAAPAGESLLLEAKPDALGATVELHARPTRPEEVEWVAFQASSAGSADWQTIAQVERAPFVALVDTRRLDDGLYDFRALAGRAELEPGALLLGPGCSRRSRRTSSSSPSRSRTALSGRRTCRSGTYARRPRRRAVPEVRGERAWTAFREATCTGGPAPSTELGSRAMTEIRTSHAGSLPRPDDLIELNRKRFDEEPYDEDEYQRELREATIGVVERQAKIGIDVPNDGEYGHAMGAKVDYGAWWHYSFARLGGLGRWTYMAGLPTAPPAKTIRLATFMQRRDWNRFAEAYADPDAGIAARAKSSKDEPEMGMALPVCTGPLTYTGQAEIERDIANFKAGLERAGAESGFLCAIGPGSASRIGNEYYETDEEFVWACAEAMREEYLAITNAGLIVQIDEPSFAENWDQFDPEPTLEQYREFTMVRVEALNHALRGIPQELTRFHCCWGSWHGPHTTDVELKDIVGMLLEIDTGGYSFEAANARHEHEWKVWQDVRLPEGKVLVPGVVGHATNVIEHPELVADRIERFASVAGAENVIAATDCGLGGRVHPLVAWAKLETLAEGARLAGRRL